MSEWKPSPGYFEVRPGVNATIETPAGYEARGEELTLYCRKRGCPSGNQGKTPDFAAYVAKGWGDIPIDQLKLRWVCEECGAKDFQTIRGRKREVGPDGRVWTGSRPPPKPTD